MRKFCISMGLLSAMAFTSSLTSAAQELGEFCWQSTRDSCVLRLQVTQHDNYFSFLGKQSCSGEYKGNEDFSGLDISEVNSHVTGSGYVNGNQAKIGLNFIDFTRISGLNSSDWTGANVGDDYDSNNSLFGEINLSDLSLIGKSTNNNTQHNDEPPNYTNIACGS